MRSDNIAYVELALQLHGCIRDRKHLSDIIEFIQAQLLEKLNPDYQSDISIEITDSTSNFHKDE